MQEETTAPVFYQIGDIARLAEVSIRAVRFYEEKGLLEPPARTSSGMRLYDDRDLQRIRLIRRLKNVGLHLGQIMDAVSTSGGPGRRSRIEHTLSVLKMEAQHSRDKVAELLKESDEREQAISLVSRCL